MWIMQIIESETQLYLFMEYASGGELFEYIDKVKRYSCMYTLECRK